MEEVEKLSPREIANSIVDDVRLRLVAPKPAYDSVDLGERLIAAALQRLQGERDHFAAYKARWEAKAEEFAGRAEAAEARGEALRKALEPFARAYATTEHDGGSFLPMVKKVSLQDFAAAKAVITAAALSDLAALDADLIVGPTAKAEESSEQPDYEADFDWKSAWYALDHDAAQLRSQVEFLKRKIKVAHVLCLGTAPKQAVGEVLAAALSGQQGSGANTSEDGQLRDAETCTLSPLFACDECGAGVGEFCRRTPPKA